MSFNEFINPELLILIPVLYLIGVGIKSSKIADKLIPLILGVCGIVLACIYVLSVNPIATPPALLTAIFTAITQGILCAGASVYANQLYKQATRDEDTDISDDKGE